MWFLMVRNKYFIYLLKRQELIVSMDYSEAGIA